MNDNNNNGYRGSGVAGPGPHRLGLFSDIMQHRFARPFIERTSFIRSCNAH